MNTSQLEGTTLGSSGIDWDQDKTVNHVEPHHALLKHKRSLPLDIKHNRSFQLSLLLITPELKSFGHAIKLPIEWKANLSKSRQMELFGLDDESFFNRGNTDFRNFNYNGGIIDKMLIIDGQHKTVCLLSKCARADVMFLKIYLQLLKLFQGMIVLNLEAKPIARKLQRLHALLIEYLHHLVHVTSQSMNQQQSPYVQMLEDYLIIDFNYPSLDIDNKPFSLTRYDRTVIRFLEQAFNVNNICRSNTSRIIYGIFVHKNVLMILAKSCGSSDLDYPLRPLFSVNLSLITELNSIPHIVNNLLMVLEFARQQLFDWQSSHHTSPVGS